MRRRINFANVAATLALLFSMSGGAFAAGHYLISSTKQISPKVLGKLKGKAGATGKEGATGREGPAGSAGVTGATGATGAEGKTGPSGKEGAAGKEGKEGPEGPEGPEGFEGESGPEGPPGPSEAYEKKSLTSTNIFSAAKTISVTVPAGSYDISAKAQEQDPEAVATGTVTCDVGPEKETALDSVVSSLAAKGEATAVLHSGFEKLSGTTTIVFTCTLTGGTSKEVLVIHPTLTAIKVGELH